MATKLHHNSANGEWEVVWSLTVRVLATLLGGLLLAGSLGLAGLFLRTARLEAKIDQLVADRHRYVTHEELRYAIEGLIRPWEVPADADLAPLGLELGELVSLWHRALRYGGAPESWAGARPPVRLVPDEVTHATGKRHLGEYSVYFHLADGGRLVVREAVILYLRPSELRDTLVRCVLLHEFLHAIYLRRAVDSLRFRKENPNDHAWIDAQLASAPECKGWEHWRTSK